MSTTEPVAPWPATDEDRGVLDPAAARRRFSLRRDDPPPEAARWIERLWETAWDLPTGTHHLQRILPHPSVNVVLYPAYAEVAAPEALPPGGARARTVAMVHGIVPRLDERRLEGRGRAIGAKLRPGALAGISALPVGSLAQRPATLPETFGPGGAALERDLLDAAGEPDAVRDLLAAFVAGRGEEDDPTLDLVQEVVADMLARGPAARVADVAADHGVSTRTLQRVFRDRVGVGPKWVLQRHRDHLLAERLADGEDDLAGLAAELGFVDQAHMTGRFRAAVGMSPAAYARACAAG